MRPSSIRLRRLVASERNEVENGAGIGFEKIGLARGNPNRAIF